MRFLFIDPIDFSYGPKTPYQRPLGGMQSSIVYLAQALGEVGHSVIVLNHIEAPETAGPVMYLPLPKEGDAFTLLCQKIRPDVGIVLGSADVLFAAKHNLPELPWMFWTGHAHDQEHHQGFQDAEKLSKDFRYMFVSEWQERHFTKRFAINESDCVVIGHGIAPPFEALLDQPLTWPERLHLTYSSTPFRGLDLLTDILESPFGTELEASIFSGMETYNRDNFGFEQLFSRLRALPYVSVPGAVSQTELATGLSRGSVWAYSNTFAETFCISAREAVAAGNLVITTTLGALPETIGPLAYKMIDATDEKLLLKERFENELQALQQQWQINRQPLMEHASAQRQWLKSYGTWRYQADRFIGYIGTWLRGLDRASS